MTPSPSPSTVAPIECLVDASSLPQGWYEDIPPHPYDLPGRVLPGRALEGISVQFRSEEFDGLARHEILRYRNEQQAEEEFQRQQVSKFFNAGRVTPWETPETVSLEDLAADQYRLSCANIEAAGQFRLCTSMAQYGNHLSTFTTWMSPDYMTYEDLKGILWAIDQRMAQCLGQPLSSSSNED